MADSNSPSGETDDERDIRLNKDTAAFGYVWIMSVVVYASRKNSKFARYHSKQGIVLFLLSILFAIIPVIGTYLLFIAVAGMMLGFVHAAQGQYADVPIVGELAKGELTLNDVVHAAKKFLQKGVAVIRSLFKANQQNSAKSPQKSVNTDLQHPEKAVVDNSSDHPVS